MMWCKNCGQAVNESNATRITTPVHHSEVDDCDIEYISDYYCPVCATELDDADRCDCGNWKCTDDDWCFECRTERDEIYCEAVDKLKVIRNLSYKQAMDLLISE